LRGFWQPDSPSPPEIALADGHLQARNAGFGNLQKRRSVGQWPKAAAAGDHP
jgi:hypothetical protein